MNYFIRHYLFGTIFILVGIYYAWKTNYLEFALYTTAGVAFIVNALTSHPKLIAYKRPLVIVTWVLIVVAAVLFLYLLQFRF